MVLIVEFPAIVTAAIVHFLLQVILLGIKEYLGIWDPSYIIVIYRWIETASFLVLDLP